MVLIGKGPAPSTSPAEKGDSGKMRRATAEEVPGMNGAVEVRREVLVTVSGDKVTLEGYCPISDEFEPCKWRIVKAAGSGSPQFRISF